MHAVGSGSVPLSTERTSGSSKGGTDSEAALQVICVPQGGGKGGEREVDPLKIGLQPTMSVLTHSLRNAISRHCLKMHM